MRIVVDTGVLVSGLAFGGVPAQALRKVLHIGEVYVSPDLLAEYRAVPEQLKVSRKVTAEQRKFLVSGIAAFVAEARVVVPKTPVILCRDPKDDMLLECCRAARALLLVTGDRDLLELDEDVPRTAGLRRLVILTPRAWVDWAPPRNTKTR